MKYLSTRGGCAGLTFEEALFSGYLSDGGMSFAESIPKLERETLKKWSTLSYIDIIKEVIRLFVSPDEIPSHELSDLVNRAFEKFDISEIIETARLKEKLNICELFHGPTLAFKDLSLSCVGRFLQYFLEKRQKKAIVLVGTSGDTGSAAIESVRGLQGVDIIVLLPDTNVSRIQELQMTTVVEDNVHLFKVRGTSDDLDVPIKEIFKDLQLVDKHCLLSINSCNWARIMLQVAHYFYAYLQMRPDLDDEVEVVIPTGACGNVTSGVVARRMGLPVRMVCAVNSNDVVARTLSSGDFSRAPSTTATLAPAMDIQSPYNVERLLYIYSGGDAALVKSIIEQFEETGQCQIPEDVLSKMQADIRSHVVSDEGIKQTMKRCWDENQYALCPHTATAAHYIYHCRGEASRVCLATASPAKFAEACTAAGIPCQLNPQLQALLTMPTRCEPMPAGRDWTAMLRDKILSIA